MRNTVLKFGLLAGALLSALMATSMLFQEQIGFGHSLTVGYTTMVLSFLFVYFGVRSYRDTVGGGTIGFGRAFAVGMLICLVATACYIVTWEILYRFYLPDFMEKYTAYALEQARAMGTSAADLAKMTQDMASAAESYKNPLVRAAYTFLEPLPVAIVMSLLSAFLLRGRGRAVSALGSRLSAAES